MQVWGTIIIQLDIKSSYQTMFACPFGRYQFKCLPFRAVPVGNMFQHKIDKIFNNMPNVFGIADNILVLGYNEDGADHNAAVNKVLRQCREVNLKLIKDKCHFRCTSIPFFGKLISRKGIQPDPQKIKALIDMPATMTKKELQASLGIINYLGKFSLGTTDVCDLLQKLTSSKVAWTWNALYQQMFTKAKSLIEADVWINFYDNTELLF